MNAYTLAIRRLARRALSNLLAAALPLALVAVARADYEVPSAAYLPPGSYYNSATGSGATLKSQLFAITSTGFVARSYGDARYSMEITDRDPANANNILLAYNRASVDGTWDAGITFNREHLFPKNWLNLTSSQVSNTYRGVASDLFELRPCNPGINSSRGDDGYGTTAVTPPASYGYVSGSGGAYWYPGDPDRGDAARAMFYMATRYGQNQPNNLSLGNGQPQLYRMGDLASLLKWHYEDGIDNFERRRNHAIFSSSLNPSYYQGNRNPFVDHPEYVWTIFGTGANDSKLYVGANAPANGSSTTDVVLGPVIVGGTLGTTNTTLTKSGTTPTTYNITTGGEATTSSAGVGQAFTYNAGSRTIQLGLSSSTATAGLKSGTISIDNTDLTTTDNGTGSTDGNDTINITASVLAHAKPSLAAGNVVTSLTLSFGAIQWGTGTHDLPLGVSNLVNVAGFTAGLDLDGITGSGSTGSLWTSVAEFDALVAGSTTSFTASASTTTPGDFSASYQLATSDENLVGAAAGQALTVNLAATVVKFLGDTNFDGVVDTTDLGNFTSNFGAISGATWAEGDFDDNGTVDVSDLGNLASNYGQSFASGTASAAAAISAPIPEPATAVLLFPLTILLLRRRDSRRMPTG